MAIVNGTLKVLFWANYPDNIVQYSIDGVPQAPIAVNCPNAGDPNAVQCYVTIVVSVDKPSCTDVVFDGYIESACNVDGAAGQVSWSYTFFGHGTCEPYTLTCVDTGGCEGFDPGLSCDNAAYIPPPLPLIPNVPFGTVLRICYDNQIFIPQEYPFGSLPRGYELGAGDGCCYDCVRLNVGLTTNDYLSGNVRIIYTDCATNLIFVKTINQANNIIGNCIVNDSWTIIDNIDPPVITTFAAICP
jgi:hypothetical protein